MAKVEYGVALVNGEKIPVAQGALFTAGTDLISVVIDNARIVNFSAIPVIVDIWLARSTDDETLDIYKLLDSKQLAASETYILVELIGDAVPSGGAVWGEASVVDSVSFSATGTERLS